jgi:aspartate ammonia-lyase
VIGQAMFESIHILTNACYNLLEKCINGITANKEVLKAGLTPSGSSPTSTRSSATITATSSVRFVPKPVRACVKWCWSAGC